MPRLQGYNVRYVEADSAFAQFALASPQEQDKRLKDLLEPDLLVLDDMFLARRITDAGAEVLPDRRVHRRYKLASQHRGDLQLELQDWESTSATTTMEHHHSLTA